MFAVIDLSQQLAGCSLPSWYPAIGALWFLGLVVSCVAGFALTLRFHSTLRDKFPEIWESLGRPTLFLNNSIGTGLAIRRFLRKRAYEKTGDAEFIHFCTMFRYYRQFYVIYFFAGLILIWIPIIMLGKHGHHA